MSNYVGGEKDNFGIWIKPDDEVIVLSWGWAVRSMDCGTRAKILRKGSKNLILEDANGNILRARPSQLGVARRDGQNGYEGNRQ